jgi:hypothetical protein
LDFQDVACFRQASHEFNKAACKAILCNIDTPAAKVDFAWLEQRLPAPELNIKVPQLSTLIAKFNEFTTDVAYQI